MTDTVTVLTSLDPPCAKAIYLKEDGTLEATGIKHAFEYKGVERRVNDLWSLADLLDELSEFTHKCIVRGGILPGVNRARMRRLKHAREGASATLAEQSRYWLLVDIDQLPVPENVDLYRNVEETIRKHVLSRLPVVFHGASCWYQFTGGQGVKSGLNVRLAFYLDRPLSHAEIKTCLCRRRPLPGVPKKLWPKQFPIDPALYSAVQEHYVARPKILSGAWDPLAGVCERSGRIRGASDVVVVPDISQMAQDREVSDAASPATAGGGGEASSFEEYLSQIGDHECGNGCHMALLSAAGYYFYKHGADASLARLKRHLLRRMRTAYWDPKKHPRDYIEGEIKRIDDLIDSTRGYQREAERVEEEKRAQAISPWPTEPEVTLVEGEALLQAATTRFFREVVPEGIKRRKAYGEARAAFDAEMRDVSSAELEFGADADAIFSSDVGPPEPPAFVQQGVKVTPGVGKTTAAERELVACAKATGQSGVIAVPTHSKAQETEANINKLAGEQIAATWRGISQDDPENAGEKMCRRAPVAVAVVKSSGSISDLCGSEKRGFCSFRDVCGYRRQATRTPDIWVITHQLLATKPQETMADAHALVIDEAPGFSIREDDLSLSDFSANRKSDDLRAWLRRAGGVLDQIGPGEYLPRAPFEDDGFTSAVCSNLIRYEHHDYVKVAPAFNPADTDGVIEEKIEALAPANRQVEIRKAFWRELGIFLAGQEATAPRMRMSLDGTAIRISSPRLPHPDWLNRPVLHLDATLNPLVVKTWLPLFELVADIRVERGCATLHQIIDQAVSHGHVVPGSGLNQSAETRASQEASAQRIMRVTEVKAAKARRACKLYSSVFPKGTEDYVERTWKEWGTRPANLVLGHHNAVRGLNAFETSAVLVNLSRPEPRLADMEHQARILFNRHPRPSLGSGHYPRRTVALRTNVNAKVTIDETYHPDQWVDALLRQHRDAEVAQAIHRGRPVRRDVSRPLTIENISGVPVDFPVDTTGTLAEWLNVSPADILLARGMWPLSWEHKQVVLSDLYSTDEAARRGFSRNRTASQARGSLDGRLRGKSGQSPYNDSLIRDLPGFQEAMEWPVYRYKAVGAKRAHPVAFDPTLHPDPREAWTARLGKPLDLFKKIERPNMPGRSGLVASEDRLGGPPVVRPPAAPLVASDLFGTDRRVSGAPPLPAAPMHLKTDAGHVRFWPDGGEGQPILLRSVSKPDQVAPNRPPPVAEPLLTVDDIRAHVGVSVFALKTAMGRSKYRKLQGEERERAAIRWLTVKVGREQFIAAVRDLGETTKRGRPRPPA